MVFRKIKYGSSKREIKDLLRKKIKCQERIKYYHAMIDKVQSELDVTVKELEGHECAERFVANVQHRVKDVEKVEVLFE